jgi:hypothetical protein
LQNRIDVLQKLAETAPAGDRDQWYRQCIDALSIATQTGNFPEGIAKLDQLQKKLIDAKADEDLLAHGVMQRLWAEYSLSQRDPNANVAAIQEKWLGDLKTFVEQYPKTSETAEALFNLALYNENLGKTTDAAKWYQQLAATFPNAKPAAKAKGALFRLNSVGQPLRLQGTDFQGGAVDLARLRNKVVLIHYWSTIGNRWQNDFRDLTEVNSKRGGREFEIISVCLDNDPTAAKQFLAQAKLPWKQVWEKDGLDGRLANEMGVVTLPLMILVDQKGVIANQNVQAAQLETELAKLIKPAAGAGAANALRSVPTQR